MKVPDEEMIRWVVARIQQQKPDQKRRILLRAMTYIPLSVYPEAVHFTPGSGYDLLLLSDICGVLMDYRRLYILCSDKETLHILEMEGCKHAIIRLSCLNPARGTP